ncbi:MAG: type III-B CRISPR module RAMP protein Cmr4 [Defluviitaleaceae bacterium]|nr:type III-B CRISPR module RAMP protein Cmr4 [Defluviitaleaceae bacterium]
MFEHKKLMLLYTLTSAHVGSGDNLSYIDLPIQREKHTNFPKIEASSLKGSIREAMINSIKKDKLSEEDKINRILGSWENGDTPSAVSISDARILFFPVKSAKGIFAWVICPTVVRRFLQDCKLIEIDCPSLEELVEQLDNLSLENKILTYNGFCSLVMNGKNGSNEKKVMLEEILFDSEPCDKFKAWIDEVTEKFLSNKPNELTLKNDEFKKKVTMISDEDFEYFVTQSTEVVTRIKINHETGIVEDGALFTEEYLPPESILYSLLFFSEEKNNEENNKENNRMSAKCIEKEMFGMISDGLLQIGGNTTLGKGLFKIHLEDTSDECK